MKSVPIERLHISTYLLLNFRWGKISIPLNYIIINDNLLMNITLTSECSLITLLHYYESIISS